MSRVGPAMEKGTRATTDVPLSSCKMNARLKPPSTFTHWMMSRAPALQAIALSHSLLKSKVTWRACSLCSSRCSQRPLVYP